MPAGARVALTRLASGIGVGLLGAVLLLGLAAFSARATEPPVFAAIPLPYSGPGLGGWSGIDVSPDGHRFWVVTDRGKHTTGTLLRDAAGTLTGIDAPPPSPLPGLHGPDLGEHTDAEGIDVRPSDGQIHVSFEGWARLRRYRAEVDAAHWVPDVPGSTRLHKNRSFEAVTRDRFGRVYTLPERASPPGAPYPLYRFTRRDWMSVADWTVAAYLTSDASWRAVGADVGPDGALYLLERRFGLVGFGSRIRRFEIEGATRGARLDGRTLYLAPLGQHGNLEGIGIWADPQGRLRAVMVADDNQRSFQRAEMVEVVLDTRPERPASPLASGASGH